MDDYCKAHRENVTEQSHVVEHVTLRCLAVAAALCGLVGNGIVIWFVHLKTKKSSFLVYSLNLAIADALHLCFQTLFSVRQTLKPFLGDCFDLHEIFMVLRWFFYFTSLGIMTALSFQRCLSVLFPVWYRCHCPRHLPAITCALLWTLTFAFSLLIGQACGQLFTKEQQFCEELKATAAVSVFLQFSVLGVSSLLLLYRVRASAQQHQPRKLHLILLLSVLGFFLFGLPLSVIRFCVNERHHTLNDVCVLLSCINSTANAAIYFFAGGLHRRRLREPLKVVFQRALGGETEDGEDQLAPPTSKAEAARGPRKDGGLPVDQRPRGTVPTVSWWSPRLATRGTEVATSAAPKSSLPSLLCGKTKNKSSTAGVCVTPSAPG